MDIAALSNKIGVGEPVLRLLLGLLLAYVYGAIYRYVILGNKVAIVTKDQAWIRHLYNFLAGLSLVYLNFGVDSFRLLLPPIIVWILLKVGGPSIYSVGFTCSLTFAYLLWGYLEQTGDDYKLDWTTAYCVMTLRLMGFAMDYYDGNSSTNEPTKNTAKSEDGVWDAVFFESLPNLLETLGYTFFYTGVLVGPQFPFRFYENFVTMEKFEKKIKGKDGKSLTALPSYGYALGATVAMGAYYMAVTQIGKGYFPSSYCAEEGFFEKSFFQKLVYMTVAGRLVLTKYLGVWLVAEGACILSGLSFNGFNDKNVPLWNGLSNVVPYIFETFSCLGQVVLSFNINTNIWCKHYVFKRFRFLKSKELSAVFTLLFLAIWHGFAPGYFASFSLEFFDLEAEKKLRECFQPFLHIAFVRKSNIAFTWIMFIVCYLISLTTLSYATVAFDLLSWAKIHPFWSSMYYYNHVAVIVILFAGFLLQPKQSLNESKKKVE